MKKILLPMALNAQEENIPGQKNFVRTEYVKKLCKHSLVPFPVSPHSSSQVIGQVYDECSGIVFMGGLDIHPDKYGEQKHKEALLQPDAAESFEFSLVRRAVADRKPILGICRGIQLLNVAFGGSMHQHLDDLKLETSHGDSSEGVGYRYIEKCYHTININRESRLYRILEKEQLSVNSGHHQAVNRVSDEFWVTATCPSGIVEAMEHKDKDYFCVAVQSHPELPQDSFMEELFAAFSAALN